MVAAALRLLALFAVSFGARLRGEKMVNKPTEPLNTPAPTPSPWALVARAFDCDFFNLFFPRGGRNPRGENGADKRADGPVHPPNAQTTAAAAAESLSDGIFGAATVSHDGAGAAYAGDDAYAYNDDAAYLYMYDDVSADEYDAYMADDDDARMYDNTDDMHTENEREDGPPPNAHPTNAATAESSSDGIFGAAPVSHDGAGAAYYGDAASAGEDAAYAGDDAYAYNDDAAYLYMYDDVSTDEYDAYVADDDDARMYYYTYAADDDAHVYDVHTGDEYLQDGAPTMPSAVG
ncbi:hypothetical protein M885DRAFT_616299 [Pelagophyceae sp. CCMP2097]|nr:hypothetical protein M885DRAFT_616299 [Pelagophyceae sp. CCMP2097]